ncbi:MAG TPA: dihydrofolate reductase family protein [Propionicimonas sp.]|jgi:dihydrofolate reductase
MGRIVVMNHVTLDGVIQAPGRPDEDTRDGFAHGGWAQLSTSPDNEAGRAMGARMAAGGGLAGWLFGRRTYDDLLGHWNAAPKSPFGHMLNDARKWVVTSDPGPLPWPNSTAVGGVDAVRELRADTDGVLGVMGSGVLLGSLIAADLVDEYLLMIHPLVLGSGKRLFPDATRIPLRLIECTSAANGLVIALYEPTRTPVSETEPAQQLRLPHEERGF